MKKTTYVKMKTDLTEFSASSPVYRKAHPWTEFFDTVAEPDGAIEMVITNEKPVIAEGKMLAYEFAVSDGRLLKTYVAVDENDPRFRVTRKLSKLSLEVALLKRGLLGKWDAFIDGTFIPGTEYALRRFYDQANDLSESHPMCDSFKGAAKVALGVGDTEFEAILDESVWAD